MGVCCAKTAKPKKQKLYQDSKKDQTKKEEKPEVNIEPSSEKKPLTTKQTSENPKDPLSDPDIVPFMAKRESKLQEDTPNVSSYFPEQVVAPNLILISQATLEDKKLTKRNKIPAGSISKMIGQLFDENWLYPAEVTLQELPYDPKEDPSRQESFHEWFNSFCALEASIAEKNLRLGQTRINTILSRVGINYSDLLLQTKSLVFEHTWSCQNECHGRYEDQKTSKSQLFS